jgi:N-acetylglucosaminyl-diphospho-decaprenol L-rhamnosyltransferase
MRIRLKIKPLKLSIVILNYNAAAFLELCIYSVLRATKHIDSEIIVADNNSTDASLEMLESVYGDRIKVIVHDENYGFSKGNNVAVVEAQGNFLCILNPDTLVGENVFEECLAFAKAEPKAGFIGVQLIDGTGTYLPESKRHIPTPKVARQKILGNDRGYYYNEIGASKRGKVDVLVGAFMFCEKSVYDDCGGFDERYFMYGEDIDLSYTALQKGYQNYYLGDQKVVHFKGESTIKDKVYLKRFYGAMGLFYDKYFKQSIVEKKAIDLLIKTMIAVKSTQTSPKKRSDEEMTLVIEEKNFRLNGVTDYFNFESFKAHHRSKSTIIWDVKTLSFDDIANFMSKNLKLKYRFLSPKRDFYIGSDDSASRGEIKYVQ